MITFRSSVFSLGAIAIFVGCVVNNPPPVTPTGPDIPPAPATDGGGSSGSSGSTQSDAGTATAEGGKPACVQTVQCMAKQHFDMTACACVADSGNAARDGGVCVQVSMCMTNMHFDTNACSCVKN